MKTTSAAEESNLPDDGLEAMGLPPGEEWTDEDELRAHDEWTLRKLRAQLAELEQLRAAVAGTEPDAEIIEQGRRAAAELAHVEAGFRAAELARLGRRRRLAPRVLHLRSRRARTARTARRRSRSAVAARADPPASDDEPPSVALIIRGRCRHG